MALKQSRSWFEDQIGQLRVMPEPDADMIKRMVARLAWMDMNSYSEIAYVGGFGEITLNDSDTLTIPTGTCIRMPKDPGPHRASRDIQVKPKYITRGYESPAHPDDYVRGQVYAGYIVVNPRAVWSDPTGMICEVDLNWIPEAIG